MGPMKKVFTRAQCTHVPEQVTPPRATACEDCGSTSSLRLCADCGYVGCCESQRGHGRIHALQSGHHVIKSLPLSDRSFTWCYACNDYI